MTVFQYATSSTADLEKQLHTSLAQGLSKKEATQLLEKNGPNAIQETGKTWLSILLSQYNSGFMYLLMGSALISLAVGDYLNAGLLTIILLINGLLSFFQEYRAEQAAQILKSHFTFKARVIRDGAVITIDSSRLVLGDVVLLEAGNYVPADIRIISGTVFVDESSISGESVPIEKNGAPSNQEPTTIYQATNLCFLSTIVTTGSAKGVVIATGNQTQFGHIGQLSLHAIKESGLHKRISGLSVIILKIIAFTLVVFILLQLLIKGIPHQPAELLLFTLALSIGLTPEALPVVTTFTLSRGALKLAKKNVIVKRLSALEDLGTITLLCTDKTGTLTENTLSLKNYMPLDSDILLYGLLCSAQEKPTDAFDIASIESAPAAALEQQKLYERVDYIPFDPTKRLTKVLLKKGNDYLLIIRGAIDQVIAHCDMKDQRAVQDWIDAEEKEGNRVLAFAIVTDEKPININTTDKLQFAGLISFYDPIKETSVTAINKAKKLGVAIKMITGDSKPVATHVAQLVGLVNPTAAISGTEFGLLSPEEKKKTVQDSSVFCRILPEQKYEIVQLLRETNTVGYLGDGTNDVPALKTADVALVVQYASDMARDAADIILLHKNLLSVIEGIAIGRNVFVNIMKYIVASISSIFGNFYSVAVSSFFLPYLPLLPGQVLLINLLSDFPMIAISTDSVDYDELRKPQAYNIRTLIVLTSAFGALSSLFDIIILYKYSYNATVLQSHWFIFTILTELALIFSVRTRKLFYKAKRPSTWLIVLSLLAAGITLLIPHTPWSQKLFSLYPIVWADLLLIFALTLAYFLSNEACKRAIFSLLSPKS